MIIDLCNDTRYEVRAAACHEFPNIFKGLGYDSLCFIMIKTTLTEE